MIKNITGISAYQELYKYLLVLNEEQIIKLRKIATGIFQVSAFSQAEINVLEVKLLLRMR